VLPKSMLLQPRRTGTSPVGWCSRWARQPPAFESQAALVFSTGIYSKKTLVAEAGVRGFSKLGVDFLLLMKIVGRSYPHYCFFTSAQHSTTTRSVSRLSILQSSASS
jgi:hypothetical protein